MKLDNDYLASSIEEFYIIYAYTTGIGAIIPASYCILQSNLDFTTKISCIVLVRPVKAQ